MTPEQLRQRLAVLHPSRLDIRDDSEKHRGHAGNSGGSHYSISIESSLFAGKSTIIRHRLVYQAVGDLAASGIHALSIQALAPDEGQ